MITKTSLLSLAGIMISLGVTTMSTSNLETVKFISGAVEILIGIALIAIREYCKTIPDGNNNNANNTDKNHGAVRETEHG